MKKEIMFHWFGDNKPSYTDWTIENFKKMNPNWDIKYIQYSKYQIEHPFETNDKLLEISMNQAKRINISPSVIYRDLYIDQFKDPGFYVMFDLDCFPIAPLDNFFVNSAISWMSNGPGDSKSSHFRGYWTADGNLVKDSNKYIQQQDIWLTFRIINPKGYSYCYKDITTQQILKDVHMDKPLEYYGQFLVNANDQNQKDIIDEQKRKFRSCELKFGTSICNNFFTPIEHYNLTERFTNNNNV